MFALSLLRKRPGDRGRTDAIRSSWRECCVRATWPQSTPLGGCRGAARPVL